MFVVTLVRKPLSEPSVVANVLEHGTSALCINPCRVGTGKDKGIWPVTDRQGRTSFNSAVDGSLNKPVVTDTTTGRWPANVILVHQSSCECRGTRRVRGISGGASEVAPNKVYGKWKQFHASNHADPDGMEEVVAWACASDCVVVELDQQSLTGGMHGAGGKRKKMVESHYAASSFDMSGTRQMDRYGDAGGASRFFLQVATR